MTTHLCVTASGCPAGSMASGWASKDWAPLAGMQRGSDGYVTATTASPKPRSASRTPIRSKRSDRSVGYTLDDRGRIKGLMLQLVYSSIATQPFTAKALRELLAFARATNTRLGVSGMLLHVDGAFLQVLEGEHDVVERLFEHISRDPRHTRVIRLVTRDITERNFPDWSMGFFDGTGRATSLVGYRGGTGFADLLGDSGAVVKIVHDFRDGRWRGLAA